MSLSQIIVTSCYLKSGSARSVTKRKNYTKYIATRETVEKREQNQYNPNAATTEKQKEMLSELLSEFPKAKRYLEYEDYTAHPTVQNASELITTIIERHADVIGNRQNFVGYMAKRPGAEQRGAHGLFNDSDEPIVLNQVADEVAHHKGNVWSHVVSLRREDAIRLGYDIVGLEDIGTAKTCTISYQDCYYLKTNASSGVNGTTNAGVVAANETVFKTLAITLGEPYTDGTAATNYYPVFVWESELYAFKGQGTSSSPYQIGSVEDLQMLSEYTNDQYLNVKYGNAYYVQTADLDLSGIDFVPIGTEKNPFNGSYNGGYRTISNLTVSDKTYGGLFGCAESISVKNLVLNGSVDADYAGGIAGQVTEYADFTQIAASVTVSGTTTGGLIGKLENSGKITDSYQCGAVSGTNAGGLIGTYSTESTSPESLVIRSSYHGNGTVSDSGVIGTTGGETSGITLENCYYLKDTASTAVNGAAFSGATAVNATVLKALAVTLEGTYVDNTDTSLNSGYPVFAWQLGRYEFAGSGTEEDPYLIGCAEDLIALQEYVNDPSYNAVYGTAYYKQTADIDLGDMEWTTIGMSSDLVFNGVYDGDYFTVYGLNASGETYSGLFGQVGASSSGRNAGVYNVIIKYGTSCSATGVTGGVAAVLMNGASVDSCGVIGDLTGDSCVGGVVGIVRRSATISNCFHNGYVIGNAKVGGIVGYVESGTANIENCYHTVGVIMADSNVGAIVGYLITMLTCIMIDRFGVIRDYLYDRDENGEYFFGISKGNKIEVYLLTSAEDLYEYLAEESEGFRLIAMKARS